MATTHRFSVLATAFLLATSRLAYAQQPLLDCGAGVVAPGGLGAQFTATFQPMTTFFRAELRLAVTDQLGAIYLAGGALGTDLTSSAAAYRVYTFGSVGVGGGFGESGAVWALGGGAGIATQGSSPWNLAFEGRIDHLTAPFGSATIGSFLLAVRFEQ